MTWYATVLELIDMRSFSNLWYWIALAAVWARASHYVMGVPWDMVGTADRRGGQAQADLDQIVRIRVDRLLGIVDVAGLWLVGLGMAALTALALLGFVYRVEFAQAVFLIAAPMTVIGLLDVATARAIRDRALEDAALRGRLLRHRLTTQGIGIVSIFVTAMWGMYQNLNIGPLGG
ncbi:hypothetical protein OCGS_2217 [Oceaniovalibus guishaninsula JLT2003]|uniref:Component of SufBCD complex n=1 Tax=Oceaniovalibus guishaninsula JLT2003 TaxID=1231392 RepID=K2I3N0_9RHOB|nr:hypothetical protein [Oceaniovalibus guishaninsula]EKE43485.1 hypothetical protein OCGS_2217 [Oceaniovalibus guishaninsula JLT2003]